MNNKKINIVFYITLFAFLFLNIASAACTNPAQSDLRILGATWGNATHTVSPGPGSTSVPLTVTLVSSGSGCSLTNVGGTLPLYGGLTNFDGKSIATYYISQIVPAYTLFNVVFYVNIAKNVSVGPNVLISYPLYIQWNYTNSTTRATQIFNLSMPLKGTPMLSFILPNPNLIAGQVNNVTIQVINTGSGSASNIETPVSSTSSINLLNQPQTINLLQPNSSQNVSFSVYVSPLLGGSQVTFNLNAHYLSPYGYNTSAASTVGMYVLQQQGVVKVSVSNQTLLAGKLNKVGIIISNYGNAAIKNLSLVFTPGSTLSIIGSDGSATVPTIPPGKNVTVPLNIYITSSSGAVSSMAISLSYSGGSISRTLSFLTPGYINMTRVSTTLLPQQPQIGQIFTLTSTLDNLGSETAYAVTITTTPPKGIIVLGANTTFIGDISAYTPTAFSLSFTASRSLSPGNYIIPVKLQYLNNINQKLNSTFSYSVYIATGNASTAASGNFTGRGQFRNGSIVTSGSTSPYGTLGIMVAAVIILGAGVYLYKKNKKAKNKAR